MGFTSGPSGAAGLDEAAVEALIDDAIEAIPEGGGTELLTIARLASPDTQKNLASTATWEDVDATNMAVTFTVPASGNVLIRLTGVAIVTSAGNLEWAIREGTTVIKNLVVCNLTSIGTGQQPLAVSHAFYLTGLSGSKTYKWSQRAGNTLAGLSYGPTWGDASMEVWAA